ncbi:MAG: penicillin-binding protein [Peptostreptococcaceae bacterium]|nr:penicillin-binding protein [Peptostreptococcaceae bacterium]
MKRILKSRNLQITLLIFILMLVLIIRLFVLTVIENTKWSEAASGVSVKNIYTPAPRGEIFDKFGRLLAGNQQTFALQINPTYYEEDSEINNVAIEIVKILVQNGDEYYDNLPIVIENGKFSYTYQKEIEDWLISQNLPLGLSAEQAFNELRKRYDINEGLDRFAAQAELQETYKIFPPISVRSNTYLENLDKKSFLERYYLNPELNAEAAFAKLRIYFKIDKGLSNEEARKIMVIRNEISAMGYRQYLPARIATDISDSTIVAFEEKSSIFIGVEIVSETKRYYPNGNLASHLLGYMGQISENQREKYVEELDYNANDLIGQDGVESVFESTLKGIDGIKSVQVNALGELVDDISNIEPEKGKDIYLTIDMELQKTAEAALKQTLEKIQSGGTFIGEYGSYPFRIPYKNANVGAVVALEVETGDVLAMASYPDYDPNLFATGISKENWDSLQSENSRDPLAPVPMYNVAARTAVQPGSVFKMVTATAALESGLDPDRKLYDGGYVQVGNRKYACLIWNARKGSHGSVDLAKALEVSCNYYFYDIATGRDYYKGISLGYDKKITIDIISSYAMQYGLGLPTGIEISETITKAPSAARKMASMKSLLKNVLIGRAEKYFTEEIVVDKNKLNNNILEIVSWTEENPTRNQLLERMPKLGIKEDMVETVADLCKYTYYNQAEWTLGDELNIAIGQGENAYTPLQIANYVATIGNEGVRNKVSVIKAIKGIGEIIKEPGVDIEISDKKYLDDIIQGMKQVVSGSSGSMRGPFANFPVVVAAKTGTAERGGRMNPPDEVEYIKTYISRISPGLEWNDIEIEIDRLLKDYPDTFVTRDTAVRQAVINLSKGKVGNGELDAYKSEYDSFAWVVALAPADDPKIAVAVLLVQGGTSTYAGPMVKEIIGKYLQVNKVYDEYSLETKIQ